MTTLNQVSTCLGCLAGSIAEDVSDATLGMPTVATMNSDDKKCHGAISKGFQKYLSAAIAGENTCQSAADSAGNNDVSGCLDEDTAGKAAGALQKAKDGLDKSCGGATDVSHLDSCTGGSPTLANLKSCNTTEYGDASHPGFSTAYELPATICPSSVRTVVRAGCSVDGNGVPGNCRAGHGTATASTLSVGWTGIAHKVDIVDLYSISAALDCHDNPAGSCGNCDITGLDASDPQYGFYARCANAPEKPCTTPFAVDAASCGPGVQCAYFLGAPLPVSAGGTPTCTLNRIATNITGTADPDAGSSSLTLDLRALVNLGIDQSHPCPICVGDTVAQDGVKNGICKGGQKNGSSCDVQSFDLSFAPTNTDNPTDGVSLDCPPLTGAAISGSGLVIRLPLTTGPTSLPAGDDCDSIAYKCFCGVCSHDETITCNGDADCDALSSGSLCTSGTGAARKPNLCAGFTCTSVPGQTDRGQCSGMGSTDKYCDGMLRANGGGVLTCADNTDCTGYNTGDPDPDNWVCPNDDCGSCTVTQIRSCFVDPIAVTGTPSVTNPVLAGLFCLPPTSNGGVNETAGSPGPGEVKVDAIATLSY
jgi:hypothetical protein